MDARRLTRRFSATTSCSRFDPVTHLGKLSRSAKHSFAAAGTPFEPPLTRRLKTPPLTRSRTLSRSEIQVVGRQQFRWFSPVPATSSPWLRTDCGGHRAEDVRRTTTTSAGTWVAPSACKPDPHSRFSLWPRHLRLESRHLNTSTPEARERSLGLSTAKRVHSSNQ